MPKQYPAGERFIVQLVVDYATSTVVGDAHVSYVITHSEDGTLIKRGSVDVVVAPIGTFIARARAAIQAAEGVT